MRRSSSGWDAVKAIGACLLLLIAIVLVMALKVDAYGGRPECLLIRCVKVIP